MANLREIQRRMSSISSTMQITRTMEMISTARIQHALARAEEASPYKDAITNMLANVAPAGRNSTEPLLRKHDEEKHRLFGTLHGNQCLHLVYLPVIQWIKNRCLFCYLI